VNSTRQRPISRAVRLLVLIAVLLAGCTAAPSPTTPVVISATGIPAGLSLEAAQQVAGDFLNLWVANRYDAMYTMLHIKSRDATSKADFVNAYADADQMMTTLPDGKTYRLLNAIQQGEGAQIAYDVTFRTQAFGEFSDKGRVLTLESTAEGWRVAWSGGDIFAQMRDNAVLYVEREIPNRGNIYDRNGLALADQSGQQIIVTLLTEKYPTNAPEACFAQIARVIPTRDVETLKRIYGPYTGRSQAYELGAISNPVFVAQKAALEAVCKLEYKSVPTRNYPQGGLAPHIVGHVGHIPPEQVAEYVAKGYSPDALVGIDGIERDWEPTLAGRGAATLMLRKGGQVLRQLAFAPAVPPQSVYLTIDAKLQQTMQNAMKEAWSSSVAWFQTSRGGAAAIMDVHTGELLAMASYPDFDVNLFNPVTTIPNAQAQLADLLKNPRKPTFNRATLGTYPLGSVFKIVSMTAAADSGKFSLDTRLTCTGVWEGASMGDRYRTDWIHSAPPYMHGTITLRQALIGSCDPYFWRVGWTLNAADPEILPGYARRMGFGTRTGIRGLSEATGQIPDPATYPETYGKKWTGSDSLDFVIGQGTMLVTPLQVVRMVAGVANGGTLYEPLIVKKTGQIGQIAYDPKPKVTGEFGVKPEVLQAVRDSMCAVTTDRTLGTATFVYRDFKGAVVCGKTGTAESGQDHPHAWFAAFAGKSADTPDIALVAIVENSYEGSYMAAPLVRHLVEAYYSIPFAPWPAWWGQQAVKIDNAKALTP